MNRSTILGFQSLPGWVQETRIFSAWPGTTSRRYLGLESLNMKELVGLMGGAHTSGGGAATDDKRGVESACGRRFVGVGAGWGGKSGSQELNRWKDRSGDAIFFKYKYQIRLIICNKLKLRYRRRWVGLTGNIGQCKQFYWSKVAIVLHNKVLAIALLLEYLSTPVFLG